ncbi:MAG: hypothetical protein LUC21_07560, partial [Oscillospiraceae bacterium]|nr:hypothetical protein [Oscillospiraceae bacterium]
KCAVFFDRCYKVPHDAAGSVQRRFNYYSIPARYVQGKMHPVPRQAQLLLRLPKARCSDMALTQTRKMVVSLKKMESHGNVGSWRTAWDLVKQASGGRFRVGRFFEGSIQPEATAARSLYLQRGHGCAKGS